MLSFENRLITYYEWLWGSAYNWQQPDKWGFAIGAVIIIFALALLVPFFWFVIASFSRGPSEAFYLVSRSILSVFTEDAPGFSLRRTLAIAKLSLQEAVRNRVLIAFGLFLVVLLVAGLFLDVKNSNPARLYLSFVISTTNYLLLLMTVFLSTFSIPNDIKNRTIYTVVTKPVRASEMVLGRIMGFMGIGSLMLLAMCAVSYVFILRGLTHSHEVVTDSFQAVVDETGAPTTMEKGETTNNYHHQHEIVIDENGKATASTVMGHTHEVTVTGTGKDRKLTLGPPLGMLQAKAPIYGRLQVIDSSGNSSVTGGISVGDEWSYRGYIEGGYNTKAAAIWTFDGITKERYPNGLPLEINLQVFRTYKGNIERGVLGEIILRNPDETARVRQSGPIVFESREFVSDYKLINKENPKYQIDPFDYVSDDGRIQVIIKCAEPSQYFGIAQADVYLRPSDGIFELNFIKAYFSIWLQMLLVTCFGVMFSTFLSGPIALLATNAGVVLGLFGEFARNVATGAEQGGGPIESIIRLVTQQNQTTDMEMNAIAMNIIKGFDSTLMYFMYGLTYILPDLTQFDSSQFVANGIDIYPAVVLRQLTMALVYAACATFAGYFFLKSREIAA
ncbi:hypothetical protein ETAA8_05430 [Anatilimnocola aggregata]|uniref:ABC transporter permease n=1 Tax=Anatilimnocola aggregata TaxID=2528021 RepID=A0A517Y5G7_9BACT|nr:ABC transporter permease [Anatilimnocola aggregata]QDU25475.1 hypothetical protein ETAA8_05430 [Anatilimnocola aggregata]